MSIINFEHEKIAVILCGIQGSGKSTFYFRHLADRFERINLDTLKTRNREKNLLTSLIADGRSFAVDNTNPTAADRARYIPAVKDAGYYIVGMYFPPDKDFSFAHNALREGKARVPDIAIHATAAKFEVPAFDEGFDEIWQVVNDGSTFNVTNHIKAIPHIEEFTF